MASTAIAFGVVLLVLGAAIRFERYLKSGSGRAVAKRHYDPDLPASS